MIGRLLKPLRNQSFFLFGARGTGKTTFIEHFLSSQSSEVLTYDLLNPKVADDLMMDPDLFRRQILEKENLKKIIYVDEVQKTPNLLDIVHQLIVKENRVFILTGSSARRLKQAGVNLLAGRAVVYQLFPFSSFELGESFHLGRALERGLLPQAYLSQSDEHAEEFLRAYVLTYVEKEIQLEQWVRKIAPFRRFLEVSAQKSGKIVNRSAIARDVGVDDMTIASYYEILEDTHLGVELPSFHESVRKAQRSAPKFFLFDNGVKRSLDRTLVSKLVPRTSAFGDAFEHFIVMELVKGASYKRLDWRFSYLRTKEDVEIDLIIDRPGKPRAMIEVKSKEKITPADVKSLETLGKDTDARADRFLVSLDKNNQQIGSTRALYWKDALVELLEL